MIKQIVGKQIQKIFIYRTHYKDFCHDAQSFQLKRKKNNSKN
jgi:hypothetical protein